MAEKNKECVVVIPTHKGTMTDEEERSLRNTLAVLKNWDIALLLPQEVSPDHYEAIRVKDELQYKIIVGRPEWMGSVEKYNAMALSPNFYRLFENYEYVLICHLDAWIFRDELQRWIDRGYDYVGAPWFLLREGHYRSLETLMCPQGGNGGFSLRKVGKMIELTSNLNRSLNVVLFLRGAFYLIRNRRFDLLKIFVRACRGVLQDADAYQEKHNIYEDAMISIFYSLLDRRFKVAPAQDAIYFSTEVYSEEILTTRLKWRLPFAVHGYDKYFSSAASFSTYRNDENRNRYTNNLYSRDGTRKQSGDSRPLVTVVTATYNLIKGGRVDTFRQCMESVHRQTYKNIEHIIIDGSSSDGTLKLIQEYAYKGWCVCLSEKDEGVWDAMHKGYMRAKGQFVNYLNSDDYFSKNEAVEIAVNSLVTHNAEWFFSEGTIIRSDGTHYTFPTSLYGIFSCMGILQQTMFVRTDILRGMNAFRSNHITRENFLMMLLCINNIKHAYSRESLVCYREGGFSAAEYGGSNFLRTQDDFAAYFYDSLGRFWGMTKDECRSMFGWQCFDYNGIRYSYRLSKKLRIRGLRWSFRRKLALHTYHHRSSLLRKLAKALGIPKKYLPKKLR